MTYTVHVHPAHTCMCTCMYSVKYFLPVLFTFSYYQFIILIAFIVFIIIYSIIINSCLSAFITLNQTFPPLVCPNIINNGSCPLECTTQLNATLHTTGCCFSMLNNTAYSNPNITGPYEYMYWTECGVPVPEICEFDYNTAVLNGSNIVSTITALLYSLIFVSLIVSTC